MKYPSFLFCFLLITLTGCNSSVNVAPTKENTLSGSTQIQATNEAVLLVQCSSNTTNQTLEEIQKLPKNSTVTVSLDANCEKAKIPSEVLETLVKKELYTVHFFPSLVGSDTYYTFSKEEIQKIAKSPWKWLAMDHLTKEQYKILRNEKTPIREGFEPEGSPDFYNEEEIQLCNRALETFTGSTDSNEYEKISKERVQCYKNLLPIK